MFFRLGDKMKKIAIVEDDKGIRFELADLLKNAGYIPYVIEDFKEAKK